jgi:hypothetical protein
MKEDDMTLTDEKTKTEMEEAEYELPEEIEEAIMRISEASQELDDWWYDIAKSGASPEKIEEQFAALAEALYSSDGLGSEYGCADRRAIHKVLEQASTDGIACPCSGCCRRRAPRRCGRSARSTRVWDGPSAGR